MVRNQTKQNVKNNSKWIANQIDINLNAALEKTVSLTRH